MIILTVPTLLLLLELTYPGNYGIKLYNMKNCVWFNHLLICALMGLFIACTDEEEEGGTTTMAAFQIKRSLLK